MFGQLDRMRREFDQLLGDMPRLTGRLASAGVFPPINLTENTGNFFVRAELPGVQSDALDIQASGKTLTITGERKIAPENENVCYHRREREAGKFSRVLNLPTDIDVSKIEAKLQDGVLTVVAPKAEASKPRQVLIN